MPTSPAAQVFSNCSPTAQVHRAGGRLARRRTARCEVSCRSGHRIGIQPSLWDIFDMFSQVDRSIERSLAASDWARVVKASRNARRRLPPQWWPGKAAHHRQTTGAGNSGAPQSAAPPTAHRLAPAKAAHLVVDEIGTRPVRWRCSSGFRQRCPHGPRRVEAVERAELFPPEVSSWTWACHASTDTRQHAASEQPWGKTMTIIALTGWGQEGDNYGRARPDATHTWSSRRPFGIGETAGRPAVAITWPLLPMFGVPVMSDAAALSRHADLCA